MTPIEKARAKILDYMAGKDMENIINDTCVKLEMDDFKILMSLVVTIPLAKLRIPRKLLALVSELVQNYVDLDPEANELSSSVQA